MQRPDLPSSDTLPVAEALFARVVRAKPPEIPSLVGGLPEGQRARLALFCNARAHLRDLGHAIADTCSETILTREGGQAGIFLADRTRRDIARPTQQARMPRPISLAKGAGSAAADL